MAGRTAGCDISCNTWIGSAWAEPNVNVVADATESEEPVSTTAEEENTASDVDNDNEEQTPAEDEVTGEDDSQKDTADETTGDSSEKNKEEETESGEETPGSEGDGEEAEDTALFEAESEDSIELEDETEAFLQETAFQNMAKQVFGENESYQTIYVAGSSLAGESAYAKGTKNNPYGSLSSAMENASGNAVYVLLPEQNIAGETLDAYTGQDILKNGWPSIGKNAIIVSEDQENAYLSIDNSGWNFLANVGFYHVNIKLENTEKTEIYANGHTAVFGGEGQDNLQIFGGDCYPFLFGAGQNNTVETTNLYVNGGTWAGIYGAGSGKGAVTDSVNLNINGAVYDENGAVADDKCSIYFEIDASIKNSYTNVDYICGGAAVTGEEIGDFQIQDVNVSISNLNNINNENWSGSDVTKSMVCINGGTVNGTSNLVVRNSTIFKVRRGYGLYCDVNYEFYDSTLSVTLGDGTDYAKGAVKQDVVITVQAENTVFNGFANYQGNTNEKNAIRLVESFKNCRFTSGSSTCLFGYYYNVSGTPSVYTFDSCTFAKNYTLWTNNANYILHFINQDVKISRTSPRDFVDGTEYRIGLEIPSYIGITPMDISADNSTIDLSELSGAMKHLELTNGAAVKLGNTSFTSIEQKGTKECALMLLDGATLTVDSIQAETPLQLRPIDEEQFSTMCKITGPKDADESAIGTDTEFYFESEKTVSNTSWTLSKEKVEGMPNCIYLDSENGSDTNTGELKKPVASLEKAYELLEEDTTKDTIVLKASTIVASLPDISLKDERIVTLTATDGKNDFQSTGKLMIKGLTTNLILSTDTMIDNITVGRTDTFRYDQYCSIRAAGHKLVIGSNVKVVSNNINIFGNGTSSSVASMELTVRSNGWSNVYIDGTVGTDNGYSENKINDNTIVKVILDATVNFYANTDIIVYGGMDLRFEGRGSKIQIGGTYYGNVNIVYSGKKYATSNTQEQVNGVFYGTFTYDNVDVTGLPVYGSDIVFSGKYYKEARINLGSLCTELYIGNVLLKDAEVKDKLQIDFAGTLNDKKYIGIKSDVKVDSNAEIVINEKGSANVESLLDESSNNVTVNLLNTETSGARKKYTVSYLKNIKNINLAENVECYSTTVENTGNLSLEKDAVFEVNSGLNIGSKNQNGSLVLKDGSALKITDALHVYGTATGADSEENGSYLLLTNESDTDNFITEKIQGYFCVDTPVDGTLTLCSGGKNEDLSGQTSYAIDENTGIKVKSEEQLTFDVIDDRSKCVLTFHSADRSYVYVDANNGKDSNCGLSPEKAVQTLDQAYEIVKSGGTLVLMTNIDVSASGWKNTYNRAVHITGYDRKNKVFYPITLKLPTNMKLGNATWFECLSVNNNSSLNANAFPVTLGVPDTILEQYIDECGQDVANLKTLNGLMSIYGTGDVTRYPTSITIHSGTFKDVCPWLPGSGDRSGGGVKGELNSTVVMTGGRITGLLGRQDFTSPIGIAKYELSGGYAAKVGSTFQYDYARGTVEEQYDISGTFQYGKFVEGGAMSSPVDIVINIHDLQESAGDIYCGNSNGWVTTGGRYIINVNNATVKRIQGAEMATPYGGRSANRTVTINLGENAVLEDLYAGSTGTAEEIKTFDVNLTDSTASIRNFYNHGWNSTQKAENVTINVCSGGTNKIDFLSEELQCLQVKNDENGNASTAVFDLNSIKNVSKVKVDSGNAIYLPNGAASSSELEGSAESDAPSILYIPNAARVSVTGTVTGNNEVKAAIWKNDALTIQESGFKNGLRIDSKKSSNPDGSVIKYTGSQTLQYLTTDAEESEWLIEDSEEVSWRNTVYAGENLTGDMGDDSASGTASAPVATLSKAYEKAAEQWSELVTQKQKYESQGDAISEEDQVVLDSIKTSLNEGIHIQINGEVSLGNMDSEEMISLVRTANMTVPVSVSGDKLLWKDGVESNYTCQIPTDTVFDEITLVSTCDAYVPVLAANGYEVRIGADVHTKTAQKKFSLYGGTLNADSLSKTALTVSGGNWGIIYGGSKSSKTEQINLYLDQNADAENVYGGGQVASAQADQILLDIDGGTYKNIYGGGYNAATNGDITLNFESGEIENLYGGGFEKTANAESAKITIGSGSESKIAAVTAIYRGAGQRGGYNGDATTVLLDGAQLGSAQKNIDFCAAGYSGTVNNVFLTVTGGIVYGDLFAGGAGIDVSNTTMSEAERETYGIVQNTTTVDLNGGTINGNVFAGGNNGQVKGGTNVTYSAGTITDAIYGGGNAAGVKSSEIAISGKLGKSADVYGGSRNVTEAIRDIQESASIILKDGSSAGHVYGGSNLAGNISETVKITIPQNAVVQASLYGGGNQAALTVTPEVHVQKNAQLTGDVYGGGKGVLKSENLLARAFLRLFTASDLIDAHVPSTNVVINGTVTGDVFAGGEYATVGTTDENADATALAEKVSNVTVTGTVIGNVYGGGKGEEGKEYAAINGSTCVSLQDGGKVTGSVFGGGQNAPVAGNTNVLAEGGIYQILYGGNDISGTISGTAQVKVSGGTAQEVYAGGYGADTINASAEVTGGTVGKLFGGGNAATVTGSSKVTVNTSDEVQHVDTVFAGNNKAAMSIKPTLNFADGKIGTVYCGGNEGIMKNAIDYEFDYPNAEIDTVFAGCNNTVEQTADVQLTLMSGTYGTVYGGNNENGSMAQTGVIVSASDENGHDLNMDTIYGGGNHADAVKTAVTVKNGEVNTVYGGGNEATVTGAVLLALNADAENGDAKITNLYCGNNQAEMAICPNLALTKGTIGNFYGGGNEGIMTSKKGLDYTFDSTDLTINTIYGGGNKAGVTGDVTLNIKNGNYTTVYGGSNSQGTVDTAHVIIQGNVGENSAGGLTGKIFGGGRGQATVVTNTNVQLQGGVISGNVYGGSGFGKVETAHVTAKEADGQTVQVLGNVFGAGYGVTSSVKDTTVDVALKLKITTDDSGDVQVTEHSKTADDISGESQAESKWKTSYQDGSYIAGNVFGGGDMGQVGQGYINGSTNTAVIEQAGTTSVNVASGYIHGNIFGGGNGQPGGTDENGNAITEYTLYMGTVFGTSSVKMTGGYVNGDVFGCGQQSRTYAADDEDADGSKDASQVTITTAETKVQDPILIGGSIFGGGNKGNGTNQNASVATVYGDTHVALIGPENQYTQIYLLSNGTTGGGVYGDGNLCLVSGKKYVTLQNFSCGLGEHANLLKTFYSLQRADRVDLISSRIVLKGAVDLVAENADDTMYSINRVSELNLKESSTIKVTKTVNLLGELTSDEQPERQFIDRGNNNGNAQITRNEYTAHGGKDPEKPLTQDEVTAYISAYNDYIQSGTVSGTKYGSINVVCVANGGYLEVKKSATEYGPVTGLFTLQLVNANPGEGGGFVYADIMGKKITENDTEKYVTGNFVCVTKQNADGNTDTYMYAYHNVGGQLTDGKYEYYLWYLKGNKYSYDVDLTGYIGTKDTDFTKTISLSVEPDYYFVLTELNQIRDVSGINLNTMYKNVWSETDDDSEKFTVEVNLVANKRQNGSIVKEETQIGYLGYETTDGTPEGIAVKDSDGKMVWGIWRKDATVANGYCFQACKGKGNSFQVSDGDALAFVGADVVNAQLVFTLHKGTGMTTEFRNLPFELKIAEAGKAEYDEAVKTSAYIQEDSCIRLTTNLNLSAIRLVPTQAAYMASGRMFAGVSSSSEVSITKTSAFTAQFVTKYIPSAFNTGSQNQITETLVTGYDDIYLLDDEGVGYTIEENVDGIKVLNIVNSSDPNVKTYEITKTADGSYQVSYKDSDGSVMTDDGGKERTYTCKAETRSSGFTLPRGTVITLLASLDENTPTYWYYYCTDPIKQVSLGDFSRMNDAVSGSKASVYDTIFTTSSSRVTENMIFVFDFSNVASEDWGTGTEEQSGNMMLRHTYKGGTYAADIMDYVSSESETADGVTTVSYSREMPKNTEKFRISADSDGVTEFDLTNADASTVYGQQDPMKFVLNITPDTNVTNTQYEEREYAVILKLRKQDGTEIPFPEGTVFTYKGKRLAAGMNNQYVIVPVETVGSHEVQIQAELEKFAAGSYQLTAALYSTSEEGYYNSIPVGSNSGDHTTADFTVKEDPVYALKVMEQSATAGEAGAAVRTKNHLATAGESFAFAVQATGGEDTDQISVKLYRYDRSGKNYIPVELEQVFTAATAPQLTTTGQGSQTWMPEVTAGAAAGTYRLEFDYHDRTEYWDFIVQ